MSLSGQMAAMLQLFDGTEVKKMMPGLLAGDHSPAGLGEGGVAGLEGVGENRLVDDKAVVRVHDVSGGLADDEVVGMVVEPDVVDFACQPLRLDAGADDSDELSVSVMQGRRVGTHGQVAPDPVYVGVGPVSAVRALGNDIPVVVGICVERIGEHHRLYGVAFVDGVGGELLLMAVVVGLQGYGYVLELRGIPKNVFQEEEEVGGVSVFYGHYLGPGNHVVYGRCD